MNSSMAGKRARISAAVSYSRTFRLSRRPAPVHRREASPSHDKHAKHAAYQP